jgi:hypothetical protein
MEEEREKEENPEALLLKLGLTRGSVVWIAAMNGHQNNWLQVFRRADATLLGSDRRQPHQTRAVR